MRISSYSQLFFLYPGGFSCYSDTEGFSPCEILTPKVSHAPCEFCNFSCYSDTEGFSPISMFGLHQNISLSCFFISAFGSTSHIKDKLR